MQAVNLSCGGRFTRAPIEIFVGGLDSNITEELMREHFTSHGELVRVKILAEKRYGFVQFANRASAKAPLQLLHETQLGEQHIQLSWDQNPNKRNSNQWNGSHFGYGQGYETYGCAQPPHDPNLYTYGAYSSYDQQQEQQNPSQWNSSYFTYGQGYETYGYAQPDPSVYAYGAYLGYGGYQQQ